jgi:hypothetical protein
MTSFPSRFLTPRQVRGLEKIGNVYFPGDGDFPSFSACGCVEHVDVVLDGLSQGDRKSLAALLDLAALVPSPVLRLLIGLSERGAAWPGRLGVALRFLRFGLRGAATTLYYSGETRRGWTGPSPLDAIQYQVSVYTADLDQTEHSPNAMSPSEGSVAACQGLLD